MTTDADNNDSFLSRWSRRKLDDGTSDDKIEPENKDSHPEPDLSPPDEKSLPVWQQKEADPDSKRQALSALFRQSEFNELDGLNEYDEDYTSFSSLGNVVTQEMKRMLRLAEEKTRPENGVQTPHTDIAQTNEQETDVNAEQNNNEDDQLA